MKKFWWGIFFAALIGVLLLAPQSNFSQRIRELFYTLQDSLAAAVDAGLLSDPVFWGLVLSAVMIFAISSISNYALSNSLIPQRELIAKLLDFLYKLLFLIIGALIAQLSGLMGQS